MKQLVAIAVLASGCLNVPGTLQPQCTTSSDCNTGNGEVCDEGVCWGDPPPGTFAAVIGPPSDRVDLVSIEIPELALPRDGYFGKLALKAPGAFNGRLEAFCAPPLDCPARPPTLGATMTITRASAVPDGQPFRAVVSSHGGAMTTTSFQAALPLSRKPNDYTVTIVPEGRGDMPDGSVTAAQLVPPARIHITVGPDLTEQHVIQLGAADLKSISGTVTSAGGFGLASYRVVAMGRWDADADPVEVSTVDYTGGDGKFQLTLASGLVGSVELVAKPYGTLAPTLHLGNLDAAKPPADVFLVQPSTAGTEKLVDVHVTAQDGSGHTQDISGARVTIDGSAQTMLPQLGRYATLTATNTTDDTGRVQLHVLDGGLLATSYTLQIVPPASSTYGVVYHHAVTLGAMEVVLPQRVSIRGVVADANGDPINGVSVTARPSLEFAWNLEGEAQRFVSEIPAAITTTPNTGEFVVWVDPVIAGVFGHYDLVFEPSDTGLVPQWATSVDMPRDNATSVALNTLKIPRPAFIHGNLVDPNGAPVVGGEIKLFQVVSGTALCDMVAHAPTGCPVPAPLVGRGAANAAGELRLAIPRP